MSFLPKSKNNSESGQALVLVLLSLAVVLTLVLFVLSRSVTDISISSNQEESVRAFSAAEAGIEKALVIGTGTGNGSATIGNASYTSKVTSLAEGLTSFNYPILLSSGDSMNVWFVYHDPATGNAVNPGTGLSYCDGTHACFTGNTMNICWGRPGATIPAAIEVTVFYEATPGDSSTMKIARAAFDPVSRSTPNAFSSVDSGACTIGGVSYAYQKKIQFSDLGIPPLAYTNVGGLFFARIKMLYNTEAYPIGVDVGFPSNTVLPSQGQDIVSTGTSGGTASAAQSTRKIEVFQGWPEIPYIFEYAIYGSDKSGGLIEQ